VRCRESDLALSAFHFPRNADLLSTLKLGSFSSITADVTEKDATSFTYVVKPFLALSLVHCSGSVRSHEKYLATIKELLLPGGTYHHCETSARKADDISLELMIAGFEVSKSTSTDAGSFEFVSQLPLYDGAAAALPNKATASAWGVVDVSAELVDEDALLAGDNAEDAIKATGDCSAKPRACADCSCGRAEAEAKGDSSALSEDQLQSFTSACGSVSVVPHQI
jgi:hypothetical protein